MHRPRHTVGKVCVQCISIVFLSILSSSAIATETNAALNGIYSDGSCETSTYQFYRVNGSSFGVTKLGVGISSPKETIVRGKYILDSRPIGQKRIAISYNWLEHGNYRQVSLVFDEEYMPDLASLPPEPPEEWDSYKFTPCKDLNPSFGFLHAEGFNFFKFVSEMDVDQCKPDSQECIQKVFGYVDVSGNSKLSKAEISRLIRIMAYLGAVQNADFSISNNDLFQTVGLVSMIAPFVASSIIDGSDYNGDQQLDLAELFLDRDIGTANQALQKMSYDLAASVVGGLFKGLPLLGELIN